MTSWRDKSPATTAEQGMTLTTVRATGKDRAPADRDGRGRVGKGRVGKGMVGRTRRAGTVLIVAGMTAVLGATTAEASVTAHVIVGHGVGYVNVRGAANTSSPVLRTVPSGAAVSLECYVNGQSVTGPFGPSVIWYAMTGGGWVTDALLETGSNSAIAPVCGPVQPSSGRAWGRTSSANTARWSQCTWGAKQKFAEYSGAFPALTGNAKDWYWSARNTGWTTVLDAQPNSIVVFQPRVQGADATAGHVAWVDATQRRADGLYAHVVEMNYAGQGHQWHTRWVKDVAGMSYVLAPPRR